MEYRRLGSLEVSVVGIGDQKECSKATNRPTP